MAESIEDAKNRGDIVIIETKPFAITPKVPNSFSEGFYEAEHYYRDVIDWLTTKVREVSKARRIFEYSLERKREHLQFWRLLEEASKEEILGLLAGEKMERVERFEHNKIRKPQPRAHDLRVKASHEVVYIFYFTKHHSKEVRNAHGHYEVRVVMPERALAKKEIKEAKDAPRFDTATLLSKFNLPELMQRRATAITEANASHTKKSDDALESILTEFERLSF